MISVLTSDQFSEIGDQITPVIANQLSLATFIDEVLYYTVFWSVKKHEQNTG